MAASAETGRESPGAMIRAGSRLSSSRCVVRYRTIGTQTVSR
jgi:hypothetical protein